jgi:hypothetical protein
MKKLFKVLGTIAMLAVLLLSFAACDDLLGSLTKDGPTTDTYLPMVYTSYDANGTKYELTITRTSKVAVPFTPAVGDFYNLTITTTAGVTQTSSGIVRDFSGNKFTLTASINVSVSFEVIISGSAITNITGTITIEGGSTVNGPGSITPTSNLVAVTEITGIPSGAVVGTPITLSGIVAPDNATNKTIEWSVKSAGSTGATISGNILSTTASGTVTVTATIANGKAIGTPYTQDFSINITSTFVAVTEITGIPSGAVLGTPITLSGIVAPDNATNKTIEWSVKSVGSTGATISGSTLSTTESGTVTVTATIANGKTASTPYTQDFTIAITNTFVAVSGVSGVPTSGTAGTPLNLSGSVAPSDATNKTIVWSVKSAGNTGAAISGNTLSTTASGTVMVTAIIANGKTASTPYTQDFSINITGRGGTITITDIPSEYNGKYAMFQGMYDSPRNRMYLLGAQSINVSTQVFTLVRISNGEVSLPMWMGADDGSIVGYSGSDNVKGAIGIFDSATVKENDQPVFIIHFDSIRFSNGNATKSCDDATDKNLIPGNGEGTLTVTDIPTEYNGKYAMFSGYNYSYPSGFVDLIGIQSLDASIQVIKLPCISDGKVSLYVWKSADNGLTYIGYSDSDDIEGTIGIFNSATVKPSDKIQPVVTIKFDSIQFSKGDAFISWNNGVEASSSGGEGGSSSR